MMMEQCLNFYLKLNANANKLCRQGPWQHEKDESSNQKLSQARCYQRVYLSITTAVVMCLTENTIRTKFIEHYSSEAATNEVEGPILHLKKMHEFIQKVNANTGNQAQTHFPNLWRTYSNDQIIPYNPNSPFLLQNHTAATETVATVTVEPFTFTILR